MSSNNTDLSKGLVLICGGVHPMHDTRTFEDVLLENGGVRAIGAQEITQVLAGRHVGTHVQLPYNAWVMPGLVDQHNHMFFTLLNEAHDGNVEGVTDPAAAFERKIVDGLATQPHGTLVLADCRSELVSPAQIFEILYRVASDREVLCIDRSYHSAVGSNALIDRMGPVYDRIRQATVMRGEIDGPFLHEDYVIEAIGGLDIDPEELAQRLVARSQMLLEQGIVEVHDKGIFGESLLRTLQDLGSLGRLTVPIVGSVQPSMLPLTSRARPGSWGNFSLKGIKYVGDGAFGSRTAWMCEHHCYDDGTLGNDTMPELEQMVREATAWADAGGTELNIHCIGDKAVLQAILLFELVLDRGLRGLTFGFEHFETATPEVLDRLERLRARTHRVRVCAQPGFNVDIGDYADRLHPGAARWINPFSTMKQRGIEWVAGTDGAITGEDYRKGLAMAVTRQGPEAISTWDAYRAACRPMETHGAAFNGVVYDRNPIADASALREAQVLMAWVDGKCVLNKVAV